MTAYYNSLMRSVLGEFVPHGDGGSGRKVFEGDQQVDQLSEECEGFGLASGFGRLELRKSEPERSPDVESHWKDKNGNRITYAFLSTVVKLQPVMARI